MLKGKQIYLDAIVENDLSLLMKWRNMPEFRKHFREYRELNPDMQRKWYENKVLDDDSTVMFAIRLIETDELLGCCGLCYINWVHRNADLSLYVGWDDSYIDDVGYAEEACHLLFDYGFKELGLQKIWTEIYVFDKPKYNLLMRLGFHVDGELRNQYFYDGKWWNSYILSKLVAEWN